VKSIATVSSSAKSSATQQYGLIVIPAGSDDPSLPPYTIDDHEQDDKQDDQRE
jgi:hypothetical protein